MRPQPEKLDLRERALLGASGIAGLVATPFYALVVADNHFDGRRTSTCVKPEHHGEALYQATKNYVNSRLNRIKTAFVGYEV